MTPPSAFPTTTAGVLSRTYFTGDEVTLSGGTFYKSNRNGKGTVSTVSQTVNVNDNQKEFFAQDVISEPYPLDTTVYSGSYSGILNGLVASGGGEQKFYLEIYKTDANGDVIDSGVSTSPVGDLGVKVITIAESGLIDLRQGDESQFSISAELTENIEILSSNRVRYHLAAEKVGTQGGAVDISVSYGFDHVAHVDIPVQATTSTVINTDQVEFPTEATQFDVNRKLKSEIQSNSDGIYNKDGVLSNDRTVDGDNNELTFTNNRELNLEGTEVTVDGTNTLIDGTTKLDLSSGIIGSEFTFLLEGIAVNGVASFLDNKNNKGIEYAANYAANWTNDSVFDNVLVTKKYVDDNAIKQSTVSSDTVKGGLFFKDDTASSTLTISNTPI